MFGRVFLRTTKELLKVLLYFQQCQNLSRSSRNPDFINVIQGDIIKDLIGQQNATASTNNMMNIVKVTTQRNDKTKLSLSKINDTVIMTMYDYPSSFMQHSSLREDDDSNDFNDYERDYDIGNDHDHDCDCDSYICDYNYDIRLSLTPVFSQTSIYAINIKSNNNPTDNNYHQLQYQNHSTCLNHKNPHHHHCFIESCRYHHRFFIVFIIKVYEL